MLRALLAITWFVFGAVAAVIGLYVLRSLSMPELEPWHREAFTEDVVSELDDIAGASLEAYLEREQRIFARLARAAVELHGRGLIGRYSRFRPDGHANPGSQARNWNRTFELEAPDPAGGALLVHGLSDSPYSLRAIGERLRAAGYHVLGLRMPGHGTIPGGLREATWRDFRAAYRMGARHLASRIGPERPLVLVGYSNGTTLAVDYALRQIEGEVERRPDLLVLISPAIRVHPVAAFARFQRLVAWLPGLEKLGWTAVLPEYDPYKYNSFPVFAGEQIHALTSTLEPRILEHAASGSLEDFPRVLAFQSVVDATIVPRSVVQGLMRHLETEAELVLFDVNRKSEIAPFLRTAHETFLQELDASPSPFALTLVTNASPTSGQVVARYRAPAQSGWSEEPLELAWPANVFSLSHVALPFPPDDPLYGRRQAESPTSLPQLGELSARGERGVFGVPMDQLARLRFNPFYAYLETRVIESVDGLTLDGRR